MKMSAPMKMSAHEDVGSERVQRTRVRGVPLMSMTNFLYQLSWAMGKREPRSFGEGVVDI